MQKTASQISTEILLKISASGQESAISKAMGWLSKPKGSKRPAFVTPEELRASFEKSQRAIEPGRKIPPRSEPKSSERMDLKKIPVWPHKAASLMKFSQGGQLDESYYEDTPSKKRHWPWAMGGAALGALGTHYLLPNEMTQSYRDTAKGLEDKARLSEKAFAPHYDSAMERYTGKIPRGLVQQHNINVKDVSAKGLPVSKLMPAHEAQKYFKGRAFAESMPRTLLGAGGGLALGLLGSSMF